MTSSQTCTASLGASIPTILTWEVANDVGDLRAWGWVILILGALQLLAAVGVSVGNQWARWFGVAVIGMNAIAQMFFLASYPFWSLMIIAGDIVALWALCAYGSRQTMEDH